MINLINFILTKYMGVLKKIYFLIFTFCSFNIIISANEDEIEFVENGANNDYDNYEYNDYDDNYDDNYDEIDDSYENYDDDYDGNYDENYEIDDNYNENYDGNYDEIDDNYNNNELNSDNNDEIRDNNDEIKKDITEKDIDNKIEIMKNRIERREQKAQKDFFESYNRLQRDVTILKARDPFNGKKNGLANLDAQYRKFRFINIGLYGKSNVSKFLKYVLGKKNPKIAELRKVTKTPTSENDIQNIYRQYLLSAGLCININIHSGGLSLVGGYCIFEDSHIFDTVDTYVGFNVDLLFRFPPIQIADFAFNILDPLGILLYFTGLRRRTEWFLGFKLCIYESKDIGKFDPGFKNNVFSDFKKLFTDKNRSIIQKGADFLFQYCTIGRRVYINQHIFYNISSSLLFPIIIIGLSKDCKQVGLFFKDCKFTDSIIDVSLGLLI